MDRRPRSQRFIDARNAKGYTRADLEKQFHIDDSFLSRIEDPLLEDNYNPRVSNVCKVAKIYGVSLDELLLGKESSVDIEVQKGSEVEVERIKTGTLSKQALLNVIKLSQTIYYRTLNAFLSSSELDRIISLIEMQKEKNTKLSLKINECLNNGDIEESKTEIDMLFTEARHYHRDTIEDIERILQGSTGYAVLRNYKERYDRMMEEEKNGES